MADITMCSGKNCPLKRNCKRFAETPSEAEEYFLNPPYSFFSKKCDMFWNKNTDKDYKQLLDITNIKECKSI